MYSSELDAALWWHCMFNLSRTSCWAIHAELPTCSMSKVRRLSTKRSASNGSTGCKQWRDDKMKKVKDDMRKRKSGIERGNSFRHFTSPSSWEGSGLLVHVRFLNGHVLLYGSPCPRVSHLRHRSCGEEGAPCRLWLSFLECSIDSDGERAQRLLGLWAGLVLGLWAGLVRSNRIASPSSLLTPQGLSDATYFSSKPQIVCLFV